MRLHKPEHFEIKVEHLNDTYAQQKKQLQAILKKQEKISLVQLLKNKKLQHPKDDKTQSSNAPKRVFVLEFHGDIQANQVERLAQEITFVLQVATPQKDCFLVKLESAGGVVHGYGLAAAQLARIRDAGFDLTVCIDKVAASGGYMMASVAQHIVSAPFAIVGSIGVVAQMPNFNNLLKSKHIDYDVYTAGQYKRTVTMFGENTEAGKQKFNQELENTHMLFKQHIQKYRSQVDIDQVATGEHWYGIDAKSLQLIDEIATSDEILAKIVQNTDVYAIKLEQKLSIMDKLGGLSAKMSHHLLKLYAKNQSLLPSSSSILLKGNLTDSLLVKDE